MQKFVIFVKFVKLEDKHVNDKQYRKFRDHFLI